MSDVLTTTPESTAWLRARSAGLVLPADVQAAVDRLEGIQAELDALEPVKVKTPSQLVAEGVPLIKAQADASKAAEKAAAIEDARRAGYATREAARVAVDRAIAAHRDNLILAIRPLVDALIERARPHAETLAPWAPAYAPNDLVRHGDAAALDAFQAAQELERSFGLLISCWRATVRAAWRPTRANSVDVRELPTGFLFWSNPHAVASDALAGRKLNRRGLPIAIQPDVLNCAAESPSSGFRLATLAECREAYDILHPNIEPIRSPNVRRVRAL